MSPRRAIGVALVVALATSSAACTSRPEGLSVAVASSLGSVLDGDATDGVRLVATGSQRIVDLVSQRAPTDAVIVAGEDARQALEGRVEWAKPTVASEVVIVSSIDDPLHTLVELAARSKSDPVVLAAQEVPAGAAARAALDLAGAPVTVAAEVRSSAAVVEAVRSREAVAGLALSADGYGDLDALWFAPIPNSPTVVYWVGIARESHDRDAAARWVELVSRRLMAIAADRPAPGRPFLVKAPS